MNLREDTTYLPVYFQTNLTKPGLTTGCIPVLSTHGSEIPAMPMKQADCQFPAYTFDYISKGKITG